MIWRIRSRERFADLARHGTRIRVTTLWCTVLIDEAATPPRVAFSIGRAVGPATTRNRLRRRLRALLREMDVPAGWLLIGARPPAARLSYGQLRAELETLIDRATQQGRRAAR